MRKEMALVDKLNRGFCLGAVLLLPVNWSVAKKPVKLVSGEIRKGVAALPRIAAPNETVTKLV